MKRALVVVDVQSTFVEKKLFDKEGMLAAIGKAIAAFRKSGDLVVFVQHCSKLAQRGTPGWAVYSGLDRRAEDPLVEKERGDAFEGTELGRTLDERRIREILVCGLVSHGCVRATCLGALAAGYRVRLLRGGHSNWAKDAEDRIARVEGELAAAGIDTVAI